MLACILFFFLFCFVLFCLFCFVFFFFLFFFYLSLMFLICVPVHVFPLPVYPRLQVQRYEPIVLVHCAFMWQAEGKAVHSLVSEAKTNVLIKSSMRCSMIWHGSEKETGSSSLFPDNNSLPNLSTCASIPVISVPGIANTTVWTKSIVALRAYVTHWKRSSAFVNIWKTKNKTKSKENCKEVDDTLLRK